MGPRALPVAVIATLKTSGEFPMTLKLYGSDLSPYVSRCRMQFLAKGLDVELLDPPNGLKSDEFTAMNPIQKMPTLEFDGWFLPESDVICEYIEDTHPTPSLRPADAKACARMRLISRIGDLYVVPAFGPLFGQMRAAEPDKGIVDKAIEDSTKTLGWLEAFIGTDGFAVGKSLRLADCALVPIMFFVDMLLPQFGNNPYDSCPNLKKYWDAIRKTSEAEQTLSRMGEGMKRMRQG